MEVLKFCLKLPIAVEFHTKFIFCNVCTTYDRYALDYTFFELAFRIMFLMKYAFRIMRYKGYEEYISFKNW